VTPERYRAAGEIFHTALSVPAGERPAFLRDACGHDDELRSEVESLLTAHAAAGTFVERPAMEVAAALIAEAARVEPRERIGRFEVISQIGRGGMGDVYRARDHALGRDVALKLPRHAATADAARRFESEARAASSLNHPNIVTIHEIGEADGRRFIAMELVEGQPLAALIGPPMELGRLVRLGRQVAQALAVAHAAGIVHGDIKPENVMLRSDGYVKVLDFGIARLASGRMETANRQATTTVTFGTPRYMSPEQLDGGVATDASDIFACGVVLYELATGRHPFGAESVPVLDRALDTQPTPLSRDGVHLPPPLERVEGGRPAGAQQQQAGNHGGGMYCGCHVAIYSLRPALSTQRSRAPERQRRTRW